MSNSWSGCFEGNCLRMSLCRPALRLFQTPSLSCHVCPAGVAACVRALMCVCANKSVCAWPQKVWTLKTKNKNAFIIALPCEKEVRSIVSNVHL